MNKNYIPNFSADYTQDGYDPSVHNWRKADTGGNRGGFPINYFFADTTRAIVVGFANFFNDMKVIHYDKAGYPRKVIDVPIKFGPRSKSHDFKKEQESGETYYIQLPNMYYKINGMTFDGNRASGLKATRTFYNDCFKNTKMAEQFWEDVQPVPYNYTIELSLKAETISDATQIMEHICTRFTPDCHFDVKEFWFFNKRRSIKMNMDNTPSITFDSDAIGEEDKREITVTFNFTIEAVLYKPIKTAYIIDHIKINMNEYPNSDHKFNIDIYGNYDGSFTDRYNFNDMTKNRIGNVSAVESVNYEFDKDTSAYIQTFNYKETDELKLFNRFDYQITTISSYPDINDDGTYTYHPFSGFDRGNPLESEYVKFDYNVIGTGLPKELPISLGSKQLLLNDELINAAPYMVSASIDEFNILEDNTEMLNAKLADNEMYSKELYNELVLKLGNDTTISNLNNIHGDIWVVSLIYKNALKFEIRYWDGYYNCSCYDKAQTDSGDEFTRIKAEIDLTTISGVIDFIYKYK